jgi:hypothetical protein
MSKVARSPSEKSAKRCSVNQACLTHLPPLGWTEEFDGAVMPVLVLLRFPTALFRVFDEPGVPAGPKLLPVVP